MYNFNISAPGKVLLYGNSQERPKQAWVIASLNIRTKLSFALLPPRVVPNEYIQLDFSSINLQMKIPLRTFLIYFFYKNFNRQCPARQIYKQVKKYVQMLSGCRGNYDPSDLRHRLSLEMFFFLLVLIAYDQGINITSTFIVKVSTKLPMGYGLGSSSSYAVCLAACFWRWSLLQKGIARFEFLNKELAKIAVYAGCCDEKIYNTLRPVDTSVIVRGGITVFANNATLKTYRRFTSIKILLVYSKINKNINKDWIINFNKIQNLNLKSESIMNSIDNLSRTSIDVFEKMKNDTDNVSVELDTFPESYYDELAELVRMNQGLLKVLNVPHGNVDLVCAIAQEHFYMGV
ncbi:mevalonate kinase-like [Pogonomyrmex barbatus]|uniref:mevalonate kinase n=1 Tax=Pogonomyrmex barbatus TaxID=144034 RepID=A0A6I9WSJ4_9HYME|nr:mevalonate kinase-like [Pogonomyrmex barbatus]